MHIVLFREVNTFFIGNLPLEQFALLMTDQELNEIRVSSVVIEYLLVPFKRISDTRAVRKVDNINATDDAMQESRVVIAGNFLTGHINKEKLE